MKPDEDGTISSPLEDRTVFEKTPVQLLPEVAELPRGDILLGYQQHAIAELAGTDVLVIEKSRRIGLTWGLGAHAALVAASTRAAGGMDVFYQGYEKEMAREFIDVVGMWAKAFGIAASEAEEFVFEDDRNPDKNIKAFRVTFASGFEVVALPSKPRAFRGKQGLVIIDEAAFLAEVQESIDAAMALLIWGGSVVIVSTHYGIDNPFNRLVNEIRAGDRDGKVVTITFEDAIADGLYERVKLVSPKEVKPKDEWIANIRKKYGSAAAQELDCIPSSGGAPWIDPADLTACQHVDAGKPELYQGGIAFHGYDVARRRDGIIQWTFEEIDGILWLREKYEEVNKKFRHQRDHFGDIMRRYRIQGAGIDQTGMGEPQVELLQDEFGELRVHGYILSGPQRLALASILRERFENGTIRIDASPETRTDLLALKRAGKDGKALMEGNVHPDRFWAAAIACAEASGVRIQYGYTPVSSLKPGNDDNDAFSRRWGEQPRGFGETENGLSRGGSAW